MGCFCHQPGMMAGIFKTGGIQHFSSGQTTFFAHEVPAFHLVKCKIAESSVNNEGCKKFGHVIRLQTLNTPNVFV